MVGRTRVLGLERTFAPGAVACLVLGVGSCIGHGVQSEATPETAGVGGAQGSSTPVGASLGGRGATGGAPQLSAAAGACSAPPLLRSAVFQPQMFDRSRLARRELFSWTTDEQAAELRRDQVLFTRSERPGLGPGYAFTVFEQLASEASDPEQAQLASVLGGELFSKARFAWSEPWATRMGWPGEDYGGNLLRIVLKPEAWVVLVKDGSLSIFDLQNQPISLADALANPTRLGAIFYEKDAALGGPVCNGSFISGGNGYREFIVGNLAMIDEWSLGTQTIRDRLSDNIQQLSTFFQRIRVCPTTKSAQQWNFSVVCDWDFPSTELTEINAYERSLAVPSENYLPVPERLVTLIETLQGDLFEPDPLVVKPGRP
ncbi:MAG TPA: hypothetical protein VFK05_37885 [Polyangiaceae bacterium]|nr:hypothetical protein [Polyangiaceae bacterium]